MKNTFILIFLFISFYSFGQIHTKNQDYSLERIGYRERVRTLEPIFQKKPTQKLALEIADALFKLKKYSKSISYYEYALNKGEFDDDNTSNYFAALYENGDYLLARKIAEIYLKKYKKTNLITKLDSAEAFKNSDQVYFANKLSFNSKNNDYGLQKFKDNFFIINSDITNINSPTSDKYYHSYLLNTSDTGSENPNYINLIEPNKNYNDVVSYFDKEENKIYLTRTNILKIPNNSDVKIYKTLKIFIANIDSNFEIKDYTEFPYNSDNYSCWNPTVSRDGEILYFVSDMMGGFGGSDLYRCMKLEEDGTWGNPINLGKNVNTNGDENYPFISPYGTTLYFSSTGSSIMGGYDIIKSEKTRFHEFLPSVNLGIPFNSNKDDIAVNFSDNYGSAGYFSSNREGGNGGFDIYEFSYLNNKACMDPVKNFTMKVIDKKTKQPVPNVFLKMIERIDNKVHEDKTDANGEVHLAVEGCNDFNVETTHDLYLNNNFYYDGFKKSVTIELDKKELNNIIELEKIYYDLGKFDVHPAAAIQLSKLAILLKRNLDIKVELSSHTDSRGDDLFNLELSQKRADQIVKYLVNSGVRSSQLVAKGYGESKIVNECLNNVLCPEELHEKNRRTEFKILEIYK